MLKDEEKLAIARKYRDMAFEESYFKARTEIDALKDETISFLFSALMNETCDQCGKQGHIYLECSRLPQMENIFKKHLIKVLESRLKSAKKRKEIETDILWENYVYFLEDTLCLIDTIVDK